MHGSSKSGGQSSRVRISLPISVAWDLEKFQRALANVSDHMRAAGQTLSKVGKFSRGREFTVDPCTLQVSEAPRALRRYEST